MIVQEQSPKRLMEVRARLYELMVHCIPPDVIFKVSPRAGSEGTGSLCAVYRGPCSRYWV